MRMLQPGRGNVLNQMEQRERDSGCIILDLSQRITGPFLFHQRLCRDEET